jgi:hypothetical protein
MEKSQVKVEVYIGAISNSAKGDWITLPLEKEELKLKVLSLKYGDDEYEILDLQTEMPIDFSKYVDVFTLNYDLNLFKAYEERGQFLLLATAFDFRNEDMEDAIQLLETGNYAYYEDVSDTESLGEAVVRSGALGWLIGLPTEAFTHLPEVKQMQRRNILQVEKVKSYIDFEKIGNDWNCNGCIIYPEMKTAMMEINPN